MNSKLDAAGDDGETPSPCDARRLTREWDDERGARVCERLYLLRSPYAPRLVDQLTVSLAIYLELYFDVGESAPSAKEVARCLSINRLTVNKAYRCLLELGFLTCRSGKRFALGSASARTEALVTLYQQMTPMAITWSIGILPLLNLVNSKTASGTIRTSLAQLDLIVGHRARVT